MRKLRLNKIAQVVSRKASLTSESTSLGGPKGPKDKDKLSYVWEISYVNLLE